MAKSLRIIPLGGLGEIGKNMTVLEYGRNMILIDCGMGFPENDMYGIDLLLPQFDYVVKNQDRLRGIVVTHGHLDHVGGLPYLLKQVKAPVYGTNLTLGMIERQLEQAGIGERSDLHILRQSDSIQLGPFKVSPFRVAHSIPDAVGFVIETPVGTVVHTGDYKLDETPAGGQTTDLKRLRELTPDGVLALLGDSTNADQPGRTPTEKLVADELDRLFAEAAGERIIVTTFSSLLARVHEIMVLAKKHGRRVALTGRSLEQNVALAKDLGYLDVADGLLVDIDAHVPDAQMLILATGSQGEPRSALNRMALGEHRQVRVRPGDNIIISGNTIPGNEEDVGRMLNRLFERGANVIYGELAMVHVSGHGSRDDMRAMIDAARPRFMLPVHGESRHLHLHARLAESAGIPGDRVFVLSNGAVWATDGRKAWLDRPVPAGDVLVDGKLVGEIGELVVEDRRRLSEDGFVVALITVDSKNRLVGEPQVISRGFVQLNESGDLLDAVREEIKHQFKKRNGRGADAVRTGLQRFLYEKTRSRPVVLPSLIRV